MSVWVDNSTGPIAAVSGDNTLLTVDEGHMVKVLSFHIVNTSTSATVVVKVGIGGSADAQLIIPAVTIPKKQIIDRTANATLKENDTLVLNASAATVTVTADYQDLYPHL